MTRFRLPSRPSKRAVRNQLAFMGGETVMEAPTRKTGPQAEGLTNKAIAQWRSLKPGLVLERNKRRLAVPVGHNAPVMLGWDLPGSADWIGYLPVRITADMVGSTVAVFCGLEAKRAEGGVVSKEQEAFLNALKDAGGISGVARNAQDAEDILTRWRENR